MLVISVISALINMVHIHIIDDLHTEKHLGSKYFQEVNTFVWPAFRSRNKLTRTPTAVFMFSVNHCFPSLAKLVISLTSKIKYYRWAIGTAVKKSLGESCILYRNVLIQFSALLLIPSSCKCAPWTHQAVRPVAVSLPDKWETWVEFLIPRFKHWGHLGSELEDRRSCLSLPFKHEISSVLSLDF